MPRSFSTANFKKSQTPITWACGLERGWASVLQGDLLCHGRRTRFWPFTSLPNHVVRTSDFQSYASKSMLRSFWTANFKKRSPGVWGQMVWGWTGNRPSDAPLYETCRLFPSCGAVATLRSALYMDSCCGLPDTRDEHTSPAHLFPVHLHR